MSDERNWIPVEIGMPNDKVDVEIKCKDPGREPVIGWHSTGDQAWFMRGERHPALLRSVEFWRPIVVPPSRLVGTTALGLPIMVTSQSGKDKTQPNYLVLSFSIDNGQRTLWVNMETVQRLRTALADLLKMIRRDELIPNSVSYMQQADTALNSSPAG